MAKNNNIIIDGRQCKDKLSTHEYLKQYLLLSHYYSENLDSLFEALIMHEEPLAIILVNIDAILENLGPYGEKLIETFQAASAANQAITFTIDPTRY